MTNEAIIDATRAMLAEVPFHDFSVRELAKALGAEVTGSSRTAVRLDGIVSR